MNWTKNRKIYKWNTRIINVAEVISITIVICMHMLQNKHFTPQIHFLVCFLTRLDACLTLNLLSSSFLATVFCFQEPLKRRDLDTASHFFLLDLADV